MSSIQSWLQRIGLDRYAETFAAEDIDVEVLPELTEADLVELGVSFGDRKKLLRAIATLTGPRVEGIAAHAAGNSAGGGRRFRRRATPSHGDVLRPGRLHRALRALRAGDRKSTRLKS